MTLEEAIAQRDAILANLGISRSMYQGRSIEYPVGDARLKELEYLDSLISAGGSSSGSTTPVSTPASQTVTRCTYAKFNRG